jgi:hypothetical protein
MKRFFLVLLMSISALSFAQSEERVAKASKHNGSAIVGFGTGGPSFGLAYEYMLDQSGGVGGHLRIFSKDDHTPGVNNGYTIVGGALHHHFYKRSWDLDFSPSFNIINIDVLGSGDDKTTFGPGLGISLMTQLTDMISVGFENARYWVWFNDDYGGMAIDDFALKIRASF